MRALVADSVSPHIRLADDVPEPRTRPDQALIRVQAFSLNRGEVHGLEGLEPGTTTGWDLAGVVARAAADGSGPSAGTRVVGVVDPTTSGARTGAWAQLAPVATEHLSTLPDDVSVEEAAALPVAGLTALRSLEIAGFVLGRRVLVTGASGGVGRFAIQLARIAGANVTAVARRAEGLADLGADEVLKTLEPVGPRYDVIIDGMGGKTLGAALGRVAPGGTIVSYGATTPEPVSYSAGELFGGAPGAQLHAFYLFAELAHTRSGRSDLRRLTDLVSAGRLDPQVDVILPWTRAGEAVTALLERRIAGKAVLTTD